MTYASFWKRTAAYLLDYFISYFISLIIGFIFGFVLARMGANHAAIQVVGILLGLGVFIGYFVCPECSSWQATIGKRIFGLKVTDENGQRISFWRSLGRYLGCIVSGLTLCIGYLMCLWTERKQCLHDKMAGCLVIDETPNEKQGCMIAMIIGFFVLLLVVFVGGILAAIALPQYARALEQARAGVAADALEQARSAQHAYYNNHGSYATRWSELNFTPCLSEKSSRCALSNDFSLELEPQGVAAQRQNQMAPYRLFRAYDLKDTRRNLVCISQQEHVKAFCQHFMERQSASRSQARY